MRRKALALCVIVSALGAVAAAQASAVTRYAAPGANGPAANCQSPSELAIRCSIATAASGAGVVPADSVVITPGAYSDTAGDLGGSGAVAQVAGDIHGAAGQPRPVITLNNVTANPAFVVHGKLSHLEIVTSVARTSNFTMSDSGSIVEDVIARSSFASSIIVVCKVNEGLLRNSACLTTGNNAVAVGTNTGGVTASGQTPELRGVTAVASGASGTHALAFYSGSTATDDGDVTLYAKNVIARAPNGVDVEVSEFGNGPDEANTQIDYSNYSTTENTGGGTIDDNGNHQTGAPALAADGYHQLPSSTSTLDLGQDDAGNGTADIDGQQRAIGVGLVDIGADELGRSTTMTVSCDPASLPLSTGPAACTATVASSAFSSPAGSVSFSSDSPGSFNGGGKCTLVPIVANAPSCEIAYTPSALGTGTHQINAVYGRDVFHEGSQDQTDLGVTPAPPDTDGDGVPDPADNCPTVAGTGADGCPPITVTPGIATGVTQGDTPVLSPDATTKKCKKGRKLKKGKCVKKKRGRKK